MITLLATISITAIAIVPAAKATGSAWRRLNRTDRETSGGGRTRGLTGLGSAGRPSGLKGLVAPAPGRESWQMNGVQFSQTGEQRVFD